ncbi:MAG TPA: nitrous oxide reductase accessory protein NosL [Thermodesulfobacteriota bacterium]|jgi:copper chaperone NosL|nr:nitrous oxide reductase accessory protein NosL [Thermodesulfobacteriota bacterium]
MKYPILISLILFVLSCSKESELLPVEIKYGQDLCAACSMIISEKQYSAQYILSDGSIKKFDDIGCMIEHLKQEKNERGNISAVFVRDYIHKNWINTDIAHFVHSNKIITPMGHGIAAFGTKEDAKNIETEIKGEYLGKLDILLDK